MLFLYINIKLNSNEYAKTLIILDLEPKLKIGQLSEYILIY